ncbi:MAG: hypothetical protein GX838_01250 [Clostridiaceae bacterium]|nr:hypothetical protein [Clostridiaceae bacterium]
MLKAKEKDKGAGQVTDELRARRDASVRKRRIRYLAVALLVIATASYAVWSILFVMTRGDEEIRLSFIRQGSIDLSTSCPLIFLDNSTAVLSPSDGVVVPLLADGERAAKDAVLALIVPSDKEAEAFLYREAKEAYEARLFVLSGFADLVRFQSPRSPSDSRMRVAIQAMTDLDGRSGIKSLYYGSERIRHEFELARSESALFAVEDEELERRSNECDSMLAYLQADPRTLLLRAPVAGEVCFTVTDLPAQDTIWQEMGREMEELPLRWAEVPVIRDDLRYTRVSQGEKIASISRFSGVNAATCLDNETADMLSIKQGGRIDLVDSAGGLSLLGCRVERVEKIGPGRLYLFVCDDSTCTFPRYAAMAEVKLVAGQSSGLRVPLASLFDLDEKTQSASLRYVKGGVTQTLEVELVARDEQYALIRSKEEERPLREADLYVANPWTTADGQLID